MFQLFTVWNGILVAAMMGINGKLSLVYGTFASTFLIYILAVVASGVFCRVSHERFCMLERSDWGLYLGGAVSIMTTIFNNFAFGKISMVSIVALGLLGQAIFSLLVDQLGWMGMKRHPFQKSSLVGVIFAFGGMIYMMWGGVYNSLLAIVFSLLSGVCVVLSRSLNSRLGDLVGMRQSTFQSLIVGLFCAFFLSLLAGEAQNIPKVKIQWEELWIYGGGCLVAIIVFINNVLVPKISSFQLTIYMFLGQVFMGIFIDLVLYRSFEFRTFIGGIIIAVGVLCNMVIKYYLDRKIIHEDVKIF